MNGYLWVTEYWTDTFGWVWLSEACACTREIARERRRRLIADQATHGWKMKSRIVKYARQ